MKNLGTPQNFFIVFRGKSINNSHEFCSEAATRGIRKKKVFFTGKHLCWSLFLMKLQSKGQQLYYKDTPTQMFSCEICETLKKTYFEQHP